MRGCRVALGTLLLMLFVSGCGACKRYMYESGRDATQRERVIRSLDIQKGARIADLGAGGGYFTFGLADATGPQGKVYAVDIDESMLAYLAERAADDGYANVEIVRAATDDPHLPEAGVDLVFVSHTYHHLTDRPAYFSRLRRCLRPGGRVAILEAKEKGVFHTLFGHATPADAIRKEMAGAGYHLDRSFDFMADDSFQIFSPNHG